MLVYAGTARAESSSGKILGMYIHQHWGYNHPYSARAWSLDDWKAYLGGLSQLGFNTVLIWPMLETIPDPPTPSDEEMLTKISAVIGYAKEQLNLRVYLTLCPNVAAHNDEALKYTFENRSFFRTEKLIDPGDPMASEAMLAWRARLLRPLANASGVYIIDSDPGRLAEFHQCGFRPTDRRPSKTPRRPEARHGDRLLDAHRVGKLQSLLRRGHAQWSGQA